MAASKYLINEDVGLPKWKIALAIGGAAAIGAGIYFTYYKYQNNSKTVKKTNVSNKLNAKSNGIASPNDNTPLGLAKQLKAAGNAEFRAGQIEKATESYTKAIKLCPPEAKHDLSIFYQNRAAAHERFKLWQKVLEDCTSALNLNPRYTKALVRRAKASENLGDLNMALEDYTAVCIIETFANQESLEVVDRLLKEIGSLHAKESFGKKREIMPSVHTVRSYFKTYCCDPVINASRVAENGHEPEETTENKDKNEGYLQALEHLRNEQFDGIIKCCNKELSDPESSYTMHSLLLRGSMKSILIDMDGAMKDLNALADMETAPTQFRVAALVKMGSLEVAFNNTEKANSLYNRALSLDPDNCDVLHQLGQMNLMNNNVEQAIEHFNKAVAQNPDFALGYVQKLHTDYRYAYFTGNKATATEIISKFGEAKKKFPKCIEVYLLLAQILVDEEKYAEADKTFQEIYKIEPNTPVAMVYQAMNLVQWKDDLKGTKDLITKALEKDPLCELALENLATIMVQTGDLKKGVELFERAIPLARTLNESAHYCSLRDAATAQIQVVKRLDIVLPTPPSL